ncbi:ABC transporter ATP-binding protein [Sulfitobacter sp. HNIBRBA3233]|uniref:ABC transporter ATP-binding protein n=1 Tax=Sulfitobacter marinivivus TaxID=3158558 RepID=UPI0032DEBBB2
MTTTQQAADPAPFLSLSSISASYGGAWVLRDVSISMKQGEFLAVIGANTAGKSTLLKAISGLMPKVTGAISFMGHDLIATESHRIPALGIAHVPEGRHVFPDMTVEENLITGAFTRGRETSIAGTLTRIYDLFPRLKERRSQPAGTLSGGEQQMVAVGRGMMLEPKLLILDEPSLGLAPMVVEEMHERFHEIHASGVSVLLVEQNVSLALESAERAYVMASGEIEFEGAARDLANDDRIRRAYLGI